jgi:DNA-binding MarR family transcriptional regulator
MEGMVMDIYESESFHYILSQLGKLHRSLVHQLLQDYEVYPGQPPLLLRLADQDGQSQNELAVHMRVKPATLTVMINRMAKIGLVERRHDPQDQRVSRVYLTGKGREISDAVRQALITIERNSLERFTVEERVLLRRMLLHMHENMRKMEN